MPHVFRLFGVFRPTREFFIHMERTEGNKSDFITSASNNSLYKCKISKEYIHTTWLLHEIFSILFINDLGFLNVFDITRM